MAGSSEMTSPIPISLSSHCHGWPVIFLEYSLNAYDTTDRMRTMVIGTRANICRLRRSPGSSGGQSRTARDTASKEGLEGIESEVKQLNECVTVVTYFLSPRAAVRNR
jgi:hypothetical protein